MKTKNSHKIIGAAALCLCAVVLAGCSKESDFGGLTGTTSGIGFEVTLKGGEETAQTRSTLGTTVFDDGELSLCTTVTENEENPFTAAKSRATEVTTDAFYDTFGAYAYIYDSGENWADNPSAELYIDKGTVTQSGGTWAFDPVRYMPSEAYKLTFFAYAPTSLESEDGSLEVGLDGTSNLPQIAYTVPSGYAEQKDLVVATATDQTKSESSVELDFTHILTAVQVKSRMPDGVISKITFSGIKNQGTYDLAEGSWTLADGTTSYEVTGEFTAAGDAEILTGEYTLMLLPQQLGEEAAIVLMYTPDGGAETTLTASLSGQEWEPGKKVTYLITVRDLNGYEAVDLGLSVVWATCNVGASSETDYGNYYAFGEIETKSSYVPSTSTWYGVSGVTEDEIKGNPLYDAATANWGGTWRLPTSDEITELINNTTQTWGAVNDVKGCTVTGTNGNSIFLPAEGYSNGTKLYDVGSNGYYWSCTPYPTNTNLAYHLHFKSGSFILHGSDTNFDRRSFGRSVRPVSK